MGEVPLIRGEIRWYTFRLPDKRRPVLVLTRDEVLEHLNEIIVAPVTRTIRGLKTEVLLTEEDGVPAACAVNSITSRWASGTASVLFCVPWLRSAGLRYAAHC